MVNKVSFIKRRTSVLFSLFFLAISTTFAFNRSTNAVDIKGSNHILGDVTQDGSVNINDVLAIMRHVLNITTLSEEGLQVADVNLDNAININDAVYLLRIVIRIINNPLIETLDVTDVSANEATGGGCITPMSQTEITARGLCWSTDNNPTIENNHTSDGTGTGSFSSNLTGLMANTTYYVRAYAISNAQVFYGREVSFTTASQSQLEPYYSSVAGLTGTALKTALHDIISNDDHVSYAQLMTSFYSTDNKGSNIVWDMYSDVPGGTPDYYYYLGSDQCGEYDSEGDCYNREHSWPQSWFNEQDTPRTDLNHIFPTDGFVNFKRGSYPFGEVKNADWTSSNGSKLGSSKTSGYSGTVFEPIDEYKGDFARALLYMSVRYYGEDSQWDSSAMTDKSEIKPWAIVMLLRWNESDPVSQKEINRNNAVYEIQGNRNPFIDHPEFARMIWD